MPSAYTDTLLTACSARPELRTLKYLTTSAGPVHVADSGGDGPCVVLTPDGPNVLAHYAHLTTLLAHHYRVICFDMPGFGFSLPGSTYRHSLEQGAQVIVEVLDALSISSATLAFSCANGLYAIAAAARARDRIAGLFLAQTPSLPAMQAWALRTIPRPLRIPVLGQLLTWTMRRKLARAWYGAALPLHADKAGFRRLANNAFNAGGCFCLAGVVQGLCREKTLDIDLTDIPCTLIWGHQDKSHTENARHSLLAYVPHATVIDFVDCGHFPDLEQPERYAALIISHMTTNVR